MTNDGTFKQIKIKNTKPDAWNGVKQVSKTLSFDASDDEASLSFFYLQDDEQKEILSISVIKEDCSVILSLDGSKSWWWSIKLDAITTKEDYTKLYGDLLYKMPDGSFKKRLSGDQSRYTTIKFLSRLNVGIIDHANHGFSLNIELAQPKLKVLPITLDPDIKNPPPDNFMSHKSRMEILSVNE